jgi:translation initiation factor 2 subunit 3
LRHGTLKLNDDIEIKPGLKVEEHGKIIWKSIVTKIIGLKSGGNTVDEVMPGGSIGVMTNLDPYVTKSDSLAGSIAGPIGKLPELSHQLDLKPILLERVVGAKDKLVVEPIKKAESLMLNVNSIATVGVVSELSKDKIHVILKSPICAEKGSRITLSRIVGTRWRLIGWAVL